MTTQNTETSIDWDEVIETLKELLQLIPAFFKTFILPMYQPQEWIHPLIEKGWSSSSAVASFIMFGIPVWAFSIFLAWLALACAEKIYEEIKYLLETLVRPPLEFLLSFALFLFLLPIVLTYSLVFPWQKRRGFPMLKRIFKLIKIKLKFKPNKRITINNKKSKSTKHVHPAVTWYISQDQMSNDL